MNETWRQIAPVVISIFIIILIAVLRVWSKTLAAITATMPVTVPLALWIVYTAEGGDQTTTVSFIASMFVGVGATLACVAGTFVSLSRTMWLAARTGWRLVPMLVAGYLAWGLMLVLSFGLRQVLGR
jgi:hypothetical protein